jgi:hypothetical protein
MRRAVVAAPVAFVLAAGCTSSPPAATSSTSVAPGQTVSTSSASTAQLQAELLAPADIGGSDWGSTDPGALDLAATQRAVESCTTPLRAPGTIAQASAGYLTAGGGVAGDRVEAVELLARFSSPPSGDFDALSAAFGKCATGGLKIAPLSLGKTIGSRSAAFVVSSTSSAADAVFAVKGDQVLFVLYAEGPAGRGRSDPQAAAARFAELAAGRMP